ncbi:hypothetical protein [Paludibacterium denitrificans]|uniref:hypothetical protein n=1 Tax=Paludibacterium denitrificans TaxID=2675226 RepID=UPI001E5B679E|nr:hypothetical protein [Paludibacterium denitrificans]
MLVLDGDERAGEPLLVPVMRHGRRLRPSPSLQSVRDYARTQVALLPPVLRQLESACPYRVEVSSALWNMALAIDLQNV